MVCPRESNSKGEFFFFVGGYSVEPKPLDTFCVVWWKLNLAINFNVIKNSFAVCCSKEFNRMKTGAFELKTKKNQNMPTSLIYRNNILWSSFFGLRSIIKMNYEKWAREKKWMISIEGRKKMMILHFENQSIPSHWYDCIPFITDDLTIESSSVFIMNSRSNDT